MAGENLTLIAVGDVRVNRAEPESAFAGTADLIRQADIAFCNMEAPYASQGAMGTAPHGAGPHDPANLTAFSYAGFHVVSLANNHAMDWGGDALMEAKDRVLEMGIQPVGAGRDGPEAHEPGIIERNGTKVAFLAYNCVGPPGTEVQEDRPGCAGVRIITSYQPCDYQPGTPPEILTFARPEDLKVMVEDVRQAKSVADVVVATFHWGLHNVRALLARYQHEVGQAAIDAGADLVLGHHPHILKGIEVYKGKVIVHSLSNFMMEGRREDGGTGQGKSLTAYQQLMRQVYQIPHPDQRKSILLRCDIAGKRITRVAYTPVLIKDNNEPEFLAQGDPRSDQVIDYMADITSEAGLDTAYHRQGDEVVVVTGPP